MSRAFYGRGLTKPAMTLPTFSSQYIRQIFTRLSARVREWRARRAAHPFVTPLYLHFPPAYNASIHRDVTPNGVRVYSLCSDCGSRLNASATLCDECAQKRSRPARPY
jgi:hypothetical protein